MTAQILGFHLGIEGILVSSYNALEYTFEGDKFPSRNRGDFRVKPTIRITTSTYSLSFDLVIERFFGSRNRF